ncbi:DUF543-domain-containing protein [Eremomyces bilateralis CBS 781.70]|uniref:MICOS complex subunit MIC10 n=1 Tax=Eremomyces bilateralis CBS 781.70 TaxID=1392243 RepID=A0A6G1GBK2_9PEZI|nr:DUF543-domain-containing protein [Eremomyces bilateralis CBS 781.70]KAF1815229.1 DUF543-domain-containing protein [Eremomyces bilateralis CBS 781.70]
MADKPSTTPSSPPTTVSRPLSEALLNDKWDRCLSSLLIRSSIGAGFGIVFSFLLFRRRSWPVWTGLGFGAGRAYEECDNSFKRAATPTKDGLRVIRP